MLVALRVMLKVILVVSEDLLSVLEFLEVIIKLKISNISFINERELSIFVLA